MVYTITKKWIFLESLAVALVIFFVGISLGNYIEGLRSLSIINDLKQDEVSLLDLSLQEEFFKNLDETSCDIAIKNYFELSDKVYDVGLNLERYDEAEQLSERILQDKRKYVLLKINLWDNANVLKEKCGNHFDVLVYFYSSDAENNFIVSKQKIISNILLDIKEKRKNTLVLLPVAGDLDLGIVELNKEFYNIDELPSILINNKIILKEFSTIEKIESYLTPLNSFESSSIIYLN